MVVRITVSLAKELIEQIDRAAKEAHVSRSALLAEAVQHFLRERPENNDLNRRKKAAAQIDVVRRRLGAWDAAGEILRWRQLH